jgi:hypothetical protein
MVLDGMWEARWGAFDVCEDRACDVRAVPREGGQEGIAMEEHVDCYLAQGAVLPDCAGHGHVSCETCVRNLRNLQPSDGIHVAFNANGDAFPRVDVLVDVLVDDSVARHVDRMAAGAFEKHFSKILCKESHQLVEFIEEVAAQSMAAELRRQEASMTSLDKCVMREADVEAPGPVARALEQERALAEFMAKVTYEEDPLAAVRLGEAAYFWFREEHEGKQVYVVRRIVGEGAGTLWFDDRGHGVCVTPEMRARCYGRVRSPEEVGELERIMAAMDRQLTQIRKVCDAAGVPDWRPYSEAERARYQTSSGTMIPLPERVKQIAERLGLACVRCVCSERQYEGEVADDE